MEEETKVKMINETINWLCWGSLLLFVFILAFVLGMKFGGGAESCKTMIKIFGCNLKGVTENSLVNACNLTG